MSSQKVLAVCGATGNQGGSVIDSILGDQQTKAQWKLRGLTRSAQSEKAKALAEKSVEVVEAEMSSEESMTSALKGAYAVFAVTDFWSIGSYEGEVKYGKNIANAAKANGVQHLIWSSQLSVKKETNGRLTSVHHFDAKADVEEYIKSIGVPASFFWPGFYASNVSLFLRPGEDGYSMALNVSADMKLPIFDAAADTGKFVKAIVKNRDSLLGKHVLGSSGYITPEQMVADFSQVKPQAGKGAKFVQIPRDAMKDGMMKGGMPEGMSEELTQMFEWFEDPGYFAGEPLEPSLKLVEEKPTTFQDFLKTDPAWKDLQ